MEQKVKGVLFSDGTQMGYDILVDDTVASSYRVRFDHAPDIDLIQKEMRQQAAEFRKGLKSGSITLTEEK